LTLVVVIISALLLHVNIMNMLNYAVLLLTLLASQATFGEAFTSARRSSSFHPHASRMTTTSMDAETSAVDQEMLQHVLAVAIDASKKAGDIILGNSGGAEITKSKANSRDLLTKIDPLCEKTIRETVLATFGDHDFLGEEDVPPGKESSAAAIDSKLSSGSDWLWIVDPIDGTTNFVHGMPLSMPSVAAAYKGEVVVGVIYDPHRDELFTAIKNAGAFMNGKPIQVGKESSIGDAVVAMGSPPAEESMQMSLLGVKALMPKVRTIRMLGSAALMLAWVANGRLTCYWEYDLSSWDISAGKLL
jgi:myo-inositol-1(or 4)-monophosphatase